ncbi:MAG: alpha-galactosidase [Monoglobaceae bacterium]
MGITFQNNIFHLFNDDMSYCFMLSKYNDLLHLYWGKRLAAEELEMFFCPRASFSAYEENDGYYSLDVLPQEYPVFGGQDLRTPACEVILPDGSRISQPRYKDHKITNGKYKMNGLPAVYTEDDSEAQTLEVTLEDEQSCAEITLYYTVFENRNVICRKSVIRNKSSQQLSIKQAYSMSVDFNDMDFNYLHLHGAWARERHMDVEKIHKGYQGIESKRGASSAAENPFVALLRPCATEDFGDVYGFSLVYSGNFKINLEVEQYGTLRVQAGINPFGFAWSLKEGEQFETPETVMVYSGSGLGEMSRTYHDLYRTRICRGKFRDAVRPVLVNNWEATYFDFNEEKILDIVDIAAQLGIELFVLDDGWFGKRNSDTCSLGDWVVNKEKLPNGIDGLADKVNQKGLQFGLWFEPEMISPDSDLYRKHPDWAIRIPGREPHKARNQLILDLSRNDVCDYVISSVGDILANANIQYVKWDMNRNMTDIYSSALPAERQGEAAHRYILGLYRIMDALTSAFPDILFEGCSGGGARFDPGILYYMPQIWCSDDTDAAERMYIQYGTSMVYPASCVTGHVSAVPNHQVGRTTPFKLRGDVASSCMMGYELDLTKMTEEEKQQARQHIAEYKEIREIVQRGELYRLLNPFEGNNTAWMYVYKGEAAVFYFCKMASPNAPLRRLKLKGLDPKKQYQIDGKTYSGSTLMYYGLLLPVNETDYASMVIRLKECGTN